MASDKVEGLANVQKNIALPSSRSLPSNHRHCTKGKKCLKDEVWITAHHFSTNFGNNYHKIKIRI